MEINLSSPRDLNQIEYLLPREFPCHEKSDSPAPASGGTPVDSNGGKAAAQSELAFEVLDEMCWTVDEIENETLQLMANIRASEEVIDPSTKLWAIALTWRGPVQLFFFLSESSVSSCTLLRLTSDSFGFSFCYSHQRVLRWRLILLLTLARPSSFALLLIQPGALDHT